MSNESASAKEVPATHISSTHEVLDQDSPSPTLHEPESGPNHLSGLSHNSSECSNCQISSESMDDRCYICLSAYGQLIEFPSDELQTIADSSQYPMLDADADADDLSGDETFSEQPITPEEETLPTSPRLLTDVPMSIIELLPMYYWHGMEDVLAEEGLTLRIDWSTLASDMFSSE